MLKFNPTTGQLDIIEASKWTTDSPGIIYAGHIAVGADADVNGTGPFNSSLQDLFGVGTVQSPLLLQETATGTPSFYNIGFGIKYGANFTGNVAGLIGNENTTTVVSGNSSNVTIAVGHYNTFIHRGTGTVSTIYGQADGVHNQSTGTITTAYAMFAQAATNTGGGSIGTVHGLLVEPQTVGSNNYGVTIGGASTNTLWLDNTADSTSAAKGIVFGVSKDTNLYRSAANTLKTDDTLIVGTAGTASGAAVTVDGTQTLTNKRVTPRVSTTTSSATPTINTDNVDMYGLTAQAADITSFTTNLSGTPTDGQKLWIYIVGTAARAITWGSSFEASTIALPTTTVSTNRLDVGFVWNAATSKWRCVAAV